MARFSYVARTEDGLRDEGEIVATDIVAATKKLFEKNLFPIKLKPSDEKQQKFFFLRAKFPFLFREDNRLFVTLFFRRMSVMADVMPIYDVISCLAANETDRRRRIMLDDISNRMENGTTLTDAMTNYPDVFSPLAVQITELCYNSGEWSEILPPFADYLEKEWQRSEKLRSDMLYPCILAILLLGATIIIVTVVVPSFAELFATLNVELPLPTRTLIFMGDFCRKYGHLFLPVLLVVLASINLLRLNDNVIRFTERIKLRLPLLGALFRQNIWAIVLNSLAILLKSGTRIDAALKLAITTNSNTVVQDILQKVYNDVTSGKCVLSVAFGQNKLFPPQAAEFISVGESSGRLDFMLGKAAEYCRVEADNIAVRINTALQPAAILLLAGLVMWLVLAIMLPLWSAVDTL